MDRRSRLLRRAAALLALPVLAAALGPLPGVRAQDPDEPSLEMPSDASLASDAAIEVQDIPVPLTGELDLTVVAADAQARVAALPERDWTMPALADALAYDPDAAFTWVRDHIGFDAYAGVLRGTMGTLGARAGNSFDRALLLHDLLEGMLVPARFAIGTLDDDAAAAVLARAFVPPTEPLPDAEEAGRPPLDLAAIAERARRDNARLRAALGDRIGAIGDEDTPRAAAEVRRHAWVQAFVGTEWVDLDPTLPDAVAGQTLTSATDVLDALPDSDHQTVTISVEAETELEGVLTPLPSFSSTIRAADAALAEIWLYFQPQLTGVGGSIVEALGGASGFVPVLLVDGVLTRGEALPTGGATDIFTGEDETGPMVARVRLVVERRVPGREPVRSVRTLLDRVVPGTAPDAPVSVTPFEVDASGPLAFQPTHHLLVSTGGTSPWRSVVRRAMAVELLDRLLALPEPDASFHDLMYPVAVANESLVLASERTIVPALGDGSTVRAWVAEPRVYVVSVGPNVPASPLPRAVTDLMADEVAVVAAPGAAPGAVARAELWYGALEAAMETEFLIALARGDGGTVRSVSVATRDPLAVFTEPDDPRLAGAPETLTGALRSGSIALVPGDPASAIGWWTVDPLTGSTRSVGRTGLGFGDYGGIRGGYPPSTPNNGPRYDITKPSGGRAAPTGTCTAANEYTTPIGCVSLPGAIAFWGLSAFVVGVIGYCASLLWQFAIS